MREGGATRYDIWIYDAGTRQSSPVLATAFDAVHARFAPDGKWITYHLHE